ncbi:MAG: GlsB/YeaQ/YmgE family stress response membrane protein [Desulfobacterales bacterium]|nr:GlsB/YeaQ/YmgE family stress response membrane protein [Desulfobacterales bacterium]
MGWIVAIIIGGVVGWLASIVMKTNAQMGCLANIGRRHRRIGDRVLDCGPPRPGVHAAPSLAISSPLPAPRSSSRFSRSSGSSSNRDAGASSTCSTPMLDGNRDGSAVDDIIGMIGKFMGGR